MLCEISYSDPGAVPGVSTIRWGRNRIDGNYNCEKFLDISMITNNMKLTKKIEGDKSCHFEIWKR